MSEQSPYCDLLWLSVLLRTCVMCSGYCAVICGMDPVCCESSSWREIAQVDKLSQGSSQPFYQV